ncbi:DUF4386 family protein [Chondromyces crocatus]|uniref:DUF4386 domain-containing protein n=1 Tax=Chondromyces crocatus TaxID=52 RepID=A0A0K1EK11_CHOCO|nr:DUF4386 family protein [Chondromyces crocatus]AKT41189.1 uncharacterized protein CMC5_053500 [Chondromyces crocatus]
MEDSSLRRLGGTASIALGASYLLVGATILMDPLRSVTTLQAFWTTFVETPWFRLTTHMLFALGALCGIAAVPGISSLVRRGNEGWVRWSMSVGTMGFAVTAVSKFREFSVEPLIAQRYVEGTDITRAVITSTPQIGLDPYGFFRYGAIGAWIFVINLVAHREGAWPKALAYLGLAGSVLYWLVPIGNLFGIQIAMVIEAAVALIGGVIIGPVWFIWAGRVVRNSAASDASRET